MCRPDGRVGPAQPVLDSRPSIPCPTRTDIVIDIIGPAIPLFVVLLLGFATGKVVGLGRAGPVALNVLVSYMALPALVFSIVAGTPPRALLPGGFIVAAVLATYLTFMMAFIVMVSVGRMRIGAAALQASAASHGNASHLGVPLSASLFGGEGALAAVLVLWFGTLVQYVLVPALNSFGHRRPARLALVEPLRLMLTDPVMVAALLGAGVAYSGLEPASLVSSTVGLIGDAAVPGALFITGLAVASQSLGRVGWEIPVITVAKLLISPLVMLSVLVLIGGIDEDWIATAVLVAALPTAAAVPRMAARLDTYASGAASSQLVTTMVSLATVVALMVLIGEGLLPTTSERLFP